MKKPKSELKKQTSIRIKRKVYFEIKKDWMTIQKWIDHLALKIEVEIADRKTNEIKNEKL